MFSQAIGSTPKRRIAQTFQEGGGGKTTVFKSHISNQEINSRENPPKSRLFLEFQEFVGLLIIAPLVRNEIRALREISRKNLSLANRVWNSILVACARKRRRGGNICIGSGGKGTLRRRRFSRLLRMCICESKASGKFV